MPAADQACFDALRPPLGCQIKHQDFGVMTMGKYDFGFAVKQGSIAGCEQVSVDLKLPAHQVHIGLAHRIELKARGLRAIKQT